MTQQEIKKKIADLEKWLDDSSLEHEARPEMESAIKILKSKLIQYDDD